MKLKVSNEAIRMFFLNATNEVKLLTHKGLRSRYTSKLQITLDQLEIHDKSIQKKAAYLQDKYAKLGDNGTFLYEGAGDNKSLVYEPEKKKELTEALEKYYEEIKTLDIELYPILEEEIPKNHDGTVRITNQLVKIFYPFVLTKEVHDALIYGDLKPIPTPEPEPKKAK